MRRDLILSSGGRPLSLERFAGPRMYQVGNKIKKLQQRKSNGVVLFHLLGIVMTMTGPMLLRTWRTMGSIALISIIHAWISADSMQVIEMDTPEDKTKITILPLFKIVGLR
jgi:hypothetical protein